MFRQAQHDKVFRDALDYKSQFGIRKLDDNMKLICGKAAEHL
jgi:hypothetical protein